LCVTKNASNTLPFPKPEGYKPATWELLRRYAKACEAATEPTGPATAATAAGGAGGGRGGAGKCQLGFPSCNTASVPNGKFDMNNCGGISSDYIGVETPFMRRLS